MPKLVTKVSALLGDTKTKTKVVKNKSRRKTAEEKIAAAAAKMNPESLKPVKVDTVDFLSLLANTLENGSVVYNTTAGHVDVLPRKPQDIVNTIKYLRRNVTMLTK